MTFLERKNSDDERDDDDKDNNNKEEKSSISRLAIEKESNVTVVVNNGVCIVRV